MSQPGVRGIRWRFGLKERGEFYADLGRFMSAGLAPFGVLTTMLERYAPRRRLKWKVTLLRRVTRAMREGSPLAKGLQPFAPPEEIAMLMSGEATGTMIEAAEQLTFVTGKRLEARTMLMQQAVPAVFLFIVLLCVTYFMMSFLMPEAKKMIPPEIMAKMVVAPVYFAFGTALTENIVLVLLGIAAAAGALSYSLPRWRPVNPIRMWLDHRVMPWTLYARLQVSFALMTIAAMMQSGVPFRRAVEDLMRNATPWLRSHLARVLDGLGRGQSQVDSLMVKFLPLDVEDRLAIYAKLPEFAKVMDELARDGMDKLAKKVKFIGWVVNISMVITMGLFIAATVMAMGEIGLTIDPRNIKPGG